MKILPDTFAKFVARTIAVAFGIPLYDGMIRFRKRITQRTGKWPRHWRRIARIFGLDLREECIPAPSNYEAMDHAAQRRLTLLRLMELSGVRWQGDELGKTVLQQPYLETPYESRTIWEFKSQIEAVSQTVRFRWQIPHDELLLADRAVDLLVGLSQYKENGKLPFGAKVFAELRELPNVRIDRIESLEREGRFPWIVVFETNQPDVFRSIIEPFANWLCIGVDLAPGRSIKYAGGCQVGLGMEGVIGGAFVAHNNRFLATCSHVLAPNCNSTVCRGDPRKSPDEPDAALISSQQPCFQAGLSVSCSSLGKVDIDNCIKMKTPVFKRHPNRSTQRGVIRGRILDFNLGGNMCRFPHLEIVPWNSTWRRILKFFAIPFSRPGDSGSWVFADSPSGGSGWVGMLVGADEENPATFAAEAEPLLDFFETATGRQYGPLQPQQFTN